MFAGPIALLKHKIDTALKSTACAIVAGLAALVALAFFCAAAFLWIARDQGAIVASLALGGAFLLVAVLALIVMLLLGRRKPPVSKPAAWMADPETLVAALDLSRSLRGRRGASFALVSAFLMGIVLSQSTPKRED